MYIVLHKERHKVIDNLPITVDETNIEQCNLAIFLGMTIDSLLNQKQHMKIVTNIVRSSHYAINRVKNLSPIGHLKTLYHTLIHPFINHGLAVWGKASKNILKGNHMLLKK